MQSSDAGKKCPEKPGIYFGSIKQSVKLKQIFLFLEKKSMNSFNKFATSLCSPLDI